MLLTLVLAAPILSCASRSPAASRVTPQSDPEASALDWIKKRQEPDGSFPTDGFLPREIGTAIVVGLLASARTDAVDVGPVLTRSIRYLESRQSPDGAFRYPKCPDLAMNTSLTLLALFACRDRESGSYRNDGGYVEMLDPRLLSIYFARAAGSPMSWDEFLEHRDVEVPVGPPGPEDLFRTARRAVANKDSAAARELRSRILGGQNADGSWDEDGPSDGRRLIAASFRIRTLRLLAALLADTLVRK